MLDKPNKTALVIIDVQQGIFNKKTKVYREYELLNNLNALIDGFHSNSVAVFFIRHTNKSSLIKDSDDWQIHSDLHFQENDIFINKVHSSAFQENILKNYLTELGIKHIVIAGLVTNGCVKAACLDARKIGYEVTLASNGHSSFHKNAENLINECNSKLSDEGIKVQPIQDILRGLVIFMQRLKEVTE